MVPKGCDGRVINDITAIAARNKNHLVVIDNFNRKVVINDLTGLFIGEFFKEDFEPSSVCITEHDQIFVTDSLPKQDRPSQRTWQVH
ncbi:hypothetical protein DPMN_091723 [Dreissena polymorpha]|uniref:Uncharacterized protein n=1 Tax=Dreissena polymorpha TaxID=45954 RepID=A0A9D4L113_DREPO|nr:hypothetical protein DPMN_091723 [Dreissena polymorpha]